MKQRFLFRIISAFALLVVAIFVSTAQVSSQEPTASQQDQFVGDVQPQGLDAPTSLLFNYQGQLLNASGNPITNPAMPMVFRLYTVSTGSTPCWSESRTIDVRNGVFNVLLGQTTALNANCLRGDAYLELVVSGETLSPRERLTSVVHAVEASTMTGNAVTQGSLNVSGNVVAAGSTTIPALSGTAKWIVTGNKPESVMYGHNLTGAFGATTQWDSDYMFTGLWDRGTNRKDPVIAWGDDSEDKLRFLVGRAGQSSPQELLSLDSNGVLAFQENPGGGAGDKASIRYYARSGESTSLELAVGNDPDDDLRLVSTGPIRLQGTHTSVLSDLSIDGWNVAFGGSANGSIALRHDGSRTLHLLPWGGSSSAWDQICIGCGSNANLVVSGNLELRGSCTAASNSPDGDDAVTVADEDCVAGSITSGAYVEANLMTIEERAAQAKSAFSEGDVLCWGEDRLVLCDAPEDPLVMAVANTDGKPIVLGAERIKVLGPVQKGDYLVASGVPGYAMATRTPSFGVVIAQALESFDGEQGLIKAMIRKM